MNYFNIIIIEHYFNYLIIGSHGNYLCTYVITKFHCYDAVKHNDNFN